MLNFLVGMSLGIIITLLANVEEEAERIANKEEELKE